MGGAITLHVLLTVAPGGGVSGQQWSASRINRFVAGDRTSGTHSLGTYGSQSWSGPSGE